MKYYITEHATYEVDATDPKSALQQFLNAPDFSQFPTDVDYRDVCDEHGTDCTEEADDQ